MDNARTKGEAEARRIVRQAQQQVDEIFAELDKPFVNGLTVLGGEPFEPRNQRELLPLLR